MQLISPDVPALRLRGPKELSTMVEKEWYCREVRPHDRDNSDSSPFVLVVLAMVRHFVQTVDKVDFREREYFQQAMWTLGQLGVSEQELAGLFSTTPNTVNRWMNGRSAPSPVVRAFAVRAGLDILRRDGLKIAGAHFDPITGRPMPAAD